MTVLSSPPAGTNADDVLSALRPMWPNATLAAGSEPRWVVLPQLDRPRILIPVGDRRTTALALQDYGRNASPGVRARTAVLAAAFRLGLGTRVARGSRFVRLQDAEGSGLLDRLATELGLPRNAVIRLGPPRSNRKPVIQLLDDHGRLIAVAKVGVDDLTAQLVRSEHAALVELADRHDGVVTTPRPLHLIECSGLPVSVQSPLYLRHGRRRLTSMELDAVVGWITAEPDRRRLSVLDSPWWKQLSDHVETSPAGPFGDLLRSARDSAAKALDGAWLEFGSWHGDLTPWNMTMVGDVPHIWDWERYAHDAPVGFDRLHYTVQSRMPGTPEVDRVIERVLAEAPQASGGLVSRADAPLVATCYALELSTRYVSEGQVTQTRGGRVATALLRSVTARTTGAHRGPRP